MNLNARRCLQLTGLAIGIMSTSALAQVAPPPTKPAKEEPKYEPQPKAAPQQAPTQAQQETKSAEQQATQPAAKPQAPNTKAANLPTSTPYPKLIKKDENGKIVRLVEYPDLLALTSNPTVGQKSVDAILPVLYGRRARFERIVIDNLDLYWMVTDGRLDTVNLNDIKEMAQVAEMIKPLVGRTTLSQELQSRGILTRTQGGMNEYIVNEYKQAVTAEIQFESDDALSDVMRFVLQDSIHETVQAYKALVAEFISQADVLVKESGLTSSSAIALAELAEPLSEDREVQVAQLEAFDDAFRNLDIEEGITLLTAMRNKRNNPDISPAIKRPNVMHARKVDTSDSGMEGYIEYSDGRRISTEELERQYEERRAKEREEFEKQKENPQSTGDDD